MFYVKENRLFMNFFTLADFGLGKENKSVIISGHLATALVNVTGIYTGIHPICNILCILNDFRPIPILKNIICLAHIHPLSTDFDVFLI